MHRILLPLVIATTLVVGAVAPPAEAVGLAETRVARLSNLDRAVGQRLEAARRARFVALVGAEPEAVGRFLVALGAGGIDVERLLRLLGRVPTGDRDLDLLAARVRSLEARRSELSGLIAAAEARLAVGLARRRGRPDRVERWRPIVERWFPPERVDEALAVIRCESRGDPLARSRRSSATGLFQFLRGTWEHASRRAGFAGRPPTDPEASIATAAWLVEQTASRGRDPWSRWSCRPPRGR